MYISGKLIPVETIPGVRGGSGKKKMVEGDESK
jgi:hypothetical protein